MARAAIRILSQPTLSLVRCPGVRIISVATIVVADLGKQEKSRDVTKRMSVVVSLGGHKLATRIVIMPVGVTAKMIPSMNVFIFLDMNVTLNIPEG